MHMCVDTYVKGGHYSVHTVYVTRFAKMDLIHASDFATLKRHNFICE